MSDLSRSPELPLVDDNVWTVMEPHSGEARQVELMNARMMLFHPALRSTRREHREERERAHQTLLGETSIAHIFETMR